MLKEESFLSTQTLHRGCRNVRWTDIFHNNSVMPAYSAKLTTDLWHCTTRPGSWYSPPLESDFQGIQLRGVTAFKSKHIAREVIELFVIERERGHKRPWGN